MVRRHGFICPWGPHQVRLIALPVCCVSTRLPQPFARPLCLQVLALVLYLYLLLAFYILTAPFLPSTASHVAFEVLYGVVAAATLGVAVMAT